MEKLTKAEEEIMKIIWKLGRCTVSDILEVLGEPKPPHSTISSIVRILDHKKNFLGHKAYGRTYEYFPLIKQEEYSKQSLHKLVADYFEGSMNNLVSFLVKEKDLSPSDLADMLQQLNESEKDADKN